VLACWGAADRTCCYFLSQNHPTDHHHCLHCWKIAAPMAPWDCHILLLRAGIKGGSVTFLHLCLCSRLLCDHHANVCTSSLSFSPSVLSLCSQPLSFLSMRPWHILHFIRSLQGGPLLQKNYGTTWLFLHRPLHSIAHQCLSQALVTVASPS